MKKILIILLTALLSWPLQVLSREWQIDPVHSNFYFDVQHVYSTVRGQFGEFTGDVYFDPDKPEQSRFYFEVKVDSIDTRIGKRDAHLRSPDFFDADKYPVMTYKSQKITYAGGNKYIAEGTLTIKEVSREIPLEFIYHGQRNNPLEPGQVVAGLDAQFMLDRLDYHVGDGKFYKMGAVGKDVSILITLELLRDK